MQPLVGLDKIKMLNHSVKYKLQLESHEMQSEIGIHNCNIYLSSSSCS